MVAVDPSVEPSVEPFVKPSSPSPLGRFVRQRQFAGAIVLGVVLLWSYRVAIATLVERWWTDSDYVYGFLVPMFSMVLLWIRRERIPALPWKGSWWGLLFLAVAGAMRGISAYFYFALLDPLSLVPCLFGLVLFIGGWRGLRWAWPAIVFLVFMVPLPGFVAGMLSHPLQRFGTIASTYLLQTMGMPAVAQGNIILLTQSRLNVMEACSGLRMMMLFFTVCVGAAMVIRRPLLDKLIIVSSAIPISVIANVIRITATGVLQEHSGNPLADYHTLAGWFMMPLAVLLLWGELALLSNVMTVEVRAEPVRVPRRKGQRAGKRRRT